MALTTPNDFGAAGDLGRRSVEAFKSAFFDRDKVINAMDRATRKVLSKFGAYVRTSARTSLRYREAVSRPGDPPSAHRSAMRKKTNKRTGVTKVQSVSPLREFILFAYERASQSVIIGPAKTNQIFFDHNREPVTGTVPSVLEYGGEITILEVLKQGRWRRADLRSKRRLEGLPTRMRTARIRERPYMTPAFNVNLPLMIQWWKDSLEG